MIRSSRVLGLLAIGSLLSGCMLGPDWQRPAMELPGRFGNETTGGEGSDASRIAPGWWRLYGDAGLDRLVEQALRANTDLALASARVLEVEAALRESSASLLPPVNLSAAGTDNRVSTTAAVPVAPNVPLVRRDYQLTASTSFELDFWGRLRRSTEAARAQVLATRDARDVVALTLAAGVTQAWFQVRSLDAQLTLVRQTLETREETLTLVRRRVAGGVGAEADLHAAAESLADARVQRVELERQRAVVVGQLGLLTGDLQLSIAPVSSRALELPLPALPPPGLPSTLLERRPDIAAAEASLAAANALIGVARAAQWPTFSLTGVLGGDSLSMSSLLQAPSRIWSMGAGVSLPVLDWGRYQARTAQAEARAQQALASWQRQVQGAFREVADALENLARARAAESDHVERATRARDRFRLVRLRHEAGQLGFLEVLDAQRSVNEAELAQVRNRQALLGYSVDLFRSLGGGWTAQ
jgi:multidrug efflux system outer membrane protein